MTAEKPVPVSPISRPAFGHEKASPDARRIAAWIMDSGDNRGTRFVIVDKIDSKFFVFDALGASPALVGLAARDDSAAGLVISPEQFPPLKGISMNKDQVKGTVKDAAGKLQQKTGEAIGSTDQQAKGMVRQAEGKVQKAVGDFKEALETTRKK